MEGKGGGGKANICEYARMQVCEGVREHMRIGEGVERGGTYGNRKRGVYINASICLYIFFNLPPIP